MTKRSIIIANWKMKLRWNEAIDLARGVVDGVKELDLEKIPEVVLCPSYTAMSKVGKILNLRESDSDSPKEQIESNREDIGIDLGAQDVFWEENGAYTGEISIEMLRDLKCKYFIIGHSERRQYLGETDEMVNKKLKKVLEVGGIPIVCVGETREERGRGDKDSTVVNQITRAFEGVKLLENQKVIIAYEPVWIIGTGQAIESNEVEYMANLIRHLSLGFCSNENNLRVIYGGSVDSGNVNNFIKNVIDDSNVIFKQYIDGFLVGTAALNIGEFLRMIKRLVIK